MQITSARRISDFQTSLNEIYENKNSARSSEYIYAYLARNTSYLSRSVLRNGDIESFFIKTFSWLLAFSSKNEINLEESFIKKFPTICPYCLASPCECIQNHKKPSKAMAAYRVREKLNDKYDYIKGYYGPGLFDIDYAVKMISGIYISNQAIWSVYGSFYHFTRIYEELGEIHEAYTTFKKEADRKINLEEEIADFTAWLLSAWKIQMEGRSLKEALINYYIEGCPVCLKQVCECSDYSDRKEAVIDTADFESLREEVSKLKETSTENNSNIMELLNSINDALATKSTTDAKRVLTQAKDTLDDISKTGESLVKVGENSVKLITLITPVYKLIEKIWDNLA